MVCQIGDALWNLEAAASEYREVKAHTWDAFTRLWTERGAMHSRLLARRRLEKL